MTHELEWRVLFDMAYGYDKDRVKEQITFDDIFEFLIDFGGDPIVRNGIILSRTICHHAPDEEASHKLYFYPNSGLFQCYTGGCSDSSFDIFQLVIKVHEIQKNKIFDLNDAVLYMANRLGIAGEEYDFEDDQLEDWQVFSDYEKVHQLKDRTDFFNYQLLPTFDDVILSRFSYINIGPWLKEGIKPEILKHHQIGFYPGEDQITIPHFDMDNRLIGIRGRTVVAEDAEKFGKYRPLRVNQVLYNHPLSKNLYNLNNAKDNIAKIGKAIVFEGKRKSRPSSLFR